MYPQQLIINRLPLNSSQKLLLKVLYDYSNRKETFHLTYEVLAFILNTSKRSIRRNMTVLRHSGYIVKLLNKTSHYKKVTYRLKALR